jgi:hypothetical protein
VPAAICNTQISHNDIFAFDSLKLERNDAITSKSPARLPAAAALHLTNEIAQETKSYQGDADF